MITLNENFKCEHITILEDGLSARSNATGYNGVASNVPLTGKQYFEMTITETSTDTVTVGISQEVSDWHYGGSISNSTGLLGYMLQQGTLYLNGRQVETMGTSNVNDIIGIGVDCDNHTIKFYKNGTPIKEYQFDATFLERPVYPTLVLTSTTVGKVNFGTSRFAIQTQAPEEWKKLRAAGFSKYDNGTLLLINQNDKYYTIKDSALEEVTDPITKTVIESVGVDAETINANLDLLEDTFKLVTNVKALVVDALKSKTQLITASNDFITTIQDNIDHFKCESTKSGNGRLKVVFSIDSGVTWKTHSGNDFIDMSIEIPQKEFSTLSEEELQKWNAAKDEILNNGIDVSALENIDFNSIEFSTIRFAYAIGVDTMDDSAVNKKLIWQFDSKGSMQQMKDTEFDVKVHSNSLEFKSLIANNMIKVNIIPNGVVFETASSGGGSVAVDAYTKQETNVLLDKKANKDEVYNKSEVDNKVTTLQEQINKNKEAISNANSIVMEIRQW